MTKPVVHVWMLPGVNVHFVNVNQIATQEAFLKIVSMNHAVSHVRWLGVHVFLKQNQNVLMNVKKTLKTYFNFIYFSGIL